MVKSSEKVKLGTDTDTLLSGVIPKKIIRKRDRKGNAVLRSAGKANIPSIAVLKQDHSANNDQEDKPDAGVPPLEARTAKYSRGEGLDVKKSKINKILKEKILRKESDIKYSEYISGRSEVLLGETPGFIEAEDGEATCTLTQRQIKSAVDITSASKQFDLALAFGPYRLDYTRSGRHLLLGGKRGHVAAFDWVTKQLLCEINVMESVYDVQWFHIESMFAVAQKEWLYVYNSQGVEMHCIQDVHRPLRTQFLPFHFLLAASTEKGWLKWLDVSVGKVVAGYNSYKGRLGTLAQNPYNAVLATGHPNGTVSMWTPNHKKPVASLLCHNSMVQAVTFDHAGYYMATSGCGRDMKLWDCRKLEGPIQSYKLRGGSASDLAFSQTGLLAASSANTVQVYKDCTKEAGVLPYLTHRTKMPIYKIEFSRYEDVLGVATGGGFTSMLVPGSGEANFDALETNPLSSKSQRRETEVRSLLDKIPPEMISLDPTVLAEVDLPTFKEKWDAKRKILFAKLPEINFVPRKKKKQANSLRRDQVKQIIRQEAKKEFFNKISDTRERILAGAEETTSRAHQKKSALDRFKPHRVSKKPLSTKK